MIEEAKQVLELPSRTATAIRRATFVAMGDDGRALVDMAGQRFVAEFGTGYVPQARETVQILTAGGRHVLLPGRALPGTGTVMTVSAGVVTVQTVVGEFVMPYVGADPVSGDLVGLSWSETPYVIGKLSVQPVEPEPVPEPDVPRIRSALFVATDTGSTDRSRSRWWQSQPWASDTTYGAWFYGSQIRDTIPASASLVSLEFYVSWEKRYGGAPRFALHNLASKSGVPVMQPYTQWAPGGGWQKPPMAEEWFAGLKDGGSALGVGLNQGGWNKFSSRVENSMSGALKISWKV